MYLSFVRVMSHYLRYLEGPGRNMDQTRHLASNLPKTPKDAAPDLRSGEPDNWVP